MLLDLTTPILVVDDEPAMVKLMTKLIKAAGFEDVDSTNQAQDALQMIAKKEYGVILSDLQMQPTSGLQLVRTIRAASSVHQPRIILTTVSRVLADVIAAKHVGVDAYLLKPFTPAQLKEKLREVAGLPTR